VVQSESQEDSESFAHVGDDLYWSSCFEDNSPSLPIEIFHVVRQNNTGDLAAWRQLDLERVALLMAGDRARDR